MKYRGSVRPKRVVGGYIRRACGLRELHTRVNVVAPVPPRPSVEVMLAHAREVVRDQVVTEEVALIYDRPQYVGVGLCCQT